MSDKQNYFSLSNPNRKDISVLSCLKEIRRLEKESEPKCFNCSRQIGILIPILIDLKQSYICFSCFK